MTLSTDILDLEQAKFVDESGNVCVRIVRVNSPNVSSPLSESIDDLEYGKFVEDENGNVAVVIKSV